MKHITDKLWNLLIDSVLEKHAGADTIMDLSIDTSIDLISEFQGINKKEL